MNSRKKNRLQLLKQIVNLRTLFAVVILAVFGIVLLAVTIIGWFQSHKILSSLCTQVGGLFVVTASITLVWELVGKRAFAEEILEKANLSRELAQAGIIKVFSSFHEREIDWLDFFETACEIDLFFLYAHSWRSACRSQLRTFLSEPKRRLRVILPDPSNNDVLTPIARNCDMTVELLKQRIEEARDEFVDLSKRTSANGSVVEIWFLPTVPTFSFYCSNLLVILALYTNRREKANVPTLVCKKHGIIYRYIREEVTGMLEGEIPIATKWYPKQETPN